MNPKSSAIKENTLNALVIGKRYTFNTPQPSPRIKDCGQIAGVPINLILSVSASTVSPSCCPVSSLLTECLVQNNVSRDIDPITKTCCANIASIDNSELTTSDRWLVPIPNLPRPSFHNFLYPLYPDAMTLWREAAPSPLTNQPLVGTKVPLHYRGTKLEKASFLACSNVSYTNDPQLTSVGDNRQSTQIASVGDNVPGQQPTTGSYQLSVGVKGKSRTHVHGHNNAGFDSSLRDRVSCNEHGFPNIDLSQKNTFPRSLRTEQITVSGVLPETKLAWPSRQEKGMSGETTLKTSRVKSGVSSALMKQTILNALSHKPWRAGQRTDPLRVSRVHYPFIRHYPSSQKRKKKKKKKDKKNKLQKKKSDSLEETTYDWCNVLEKGETSERHSETSSDTKSRERICRHTKRQKKAWERKLKRSKIGKNETRKSNRFSEKFVTAVHSVQEDPKTNSGSKESPSEAIKDCQGYSSRLREDTANMRDMSLVQTDIESPISCAFSDKLNSKDGGRCEETCLESKDKLYTAILDSDSLRQQSSHNSVSQNAIGLDSPRTDVQLNKNGAQQHQRYPSNSGRKCRDRQARGPGCRDMQLIDKIDLKLTEADESLGTATQEKFDPSERQVSASVSLSCSSDVLQAAGICKSASACITGREKQRDKICRSTRSNTCMPAYARVTTTIDQRNSGQVCSLPMLCKALEERISCRQTLESDPITLIAAERDLNPFVPTKIPLETGAKDFPFEKCGLKDNEIMDDKFSVQKTFSSVGEEVISKVMHVDKSKQTNVKDISWVPFIHSLPEGTQEGCCLYQVIATGQSESSKSKPVHSPPVCSLLERPVSRRGKATTILGKKEETTPQVQNRNKAKRSSKEWLSPMESSMRGRREIIKTIGDTKPGKKPTKGADNLSSVNADFQKSKSQSMNQKQIVPNRLFPTVSTEASINSPNTKRSKFNVPISKSLPNAKKVPLPCFVVNMRLNGQAASRGQLPPGKASMHDVENYSKLNELNCCSEAAAIGRHRSMKTEAKESTELSYNNSFNDTKHLINPEEHDFFDISCKKTKYSSKSTAPYVHTDVTFASGFGIKPKDQLNNVHSLKYLAFEALVEVTAVSPQVCTMRNSQAFGLGVTEGLFSPNSVRNNRITHVQAAHEFSCKEHCEILNDAEKGLSYVTPDTKSMKVSEPVFSDLEKLYTTSDRISKDVSPVNARMGHSGLARPKWGANKHVTTPSSASLHSLSATAKENDPIIRSVLTPIPPSVIKPCSQDIQQGYRHPSSISNPDGRESNRPQHTFLRNEHDSESGPDLSEDTSFKQVITPSDTSCDSFAKTRTLFNRYLSFAEQWESTAKHHRACNSVMETQRGVLVSSYVHLGGAKRSKTEVEFLKMARKRGLGDISVLMGIPLHSANSRKGKVTPSWKWMLNSRNRRRVPIQRGARDANMSIRGTNVGKVWNSGLPNSFDQLTCIAQQL